MSSVLHLLQEREMIFPLEIWEHVLTYLDPVTLMNFKIVCKSWYHIINKILKNSELWYKLCENKIPKTFWSTLCETLCPNKYYTDFLEGDDTKFWMTLYKHWVKCAHLAQCKTETKHIEPLGRHPHSEYITCTDTSGNLLAIGTSAGYINFYDINNLDGCTKYVVDHMEYVKSVRLLRNGATIICVSCSTNAHICFWDVKRMKLIDKSLGRLICTSYSYCYYAMYNSITIEGSIPRTEFEFNQDNIMAIGADNNKVLFYTVGGYSVCLTLDEDKKYCTYERVPPPNITVHHYYIFMPNIFVCTTRNGYIGFSVQGKEWTLHNVLPILHGIPTAVLVYAHVLIVGLDSGNVHIYNIDDFDKINFNTIHSKKLTLDHTAVISLNIMIHGGEFLIVTYRKKICIVKLI